MASNLSRVRHIAGLAIKLAGHQLHGNRRQFGHALFEALFELGGVYIKFLQMLVIRSDIFADQSLAQQIKVYEGVALEPINLDALLTSELGSSWHSHFQSVESTPFASGSFAQVYRANLLNGKEVILKVLRPSLSKTLPFDLRLLSFITRLLGIIKPSDMFNMREIYNDFRDITVSEINYTQEAAFARELYDRYQGHPTIVIPYTYLELSRRRVIVQEYLGGISVASIMAQKIDPYEYVRSQLGSDLDKQLEELGYEFLLSIFLHPTTQGDPHPGNIKLLPNDKVGLIDFGMIAESPKDRNGLLALLKEYAKIYSGNIDVQGFSLALFGMFANRLMSSIHALADFSANPSRVRRLIDEMMLTAEATFRSQQSPELERLLGSGKFLLAFSQVINRGNRFGLKLHFDATSFIRSSNMCVNLVNSLGRRSTVLQPIYTRVVAEVERLNYEAAAEHQSISYEQALEVIGDWMERVATTDPVLYHKMQPHLKARQYV